MGFSLTRQTLYALISALENDLRAILVENIPHNHPPLEVYGEELFASSISRFTAEEGEGSYINSFAELVCFIDFPDAFKIIQRNKQFLDADYAKKFTAFIPSLEKLVPIRNRVSHSRPLHFDDLPICLDVIERIQCETNFKYSSLREVQNKIAQNPGWVLELNLPAAPKDKISHNLPIPDFDETGFMGRSDHLRSLKSILEGPYPVISIIGEGGLGKSALALKVAYDLLDAEGVTFDAIVWSSAKANIVTAQEIKQIEDAVTDSLGMFREISGELGSRSSEEDQIQEILDYLKQFKILLILDNLETVIDGPLKDFFDRLPSGSKVLTTSRIGLGEFERRLNLSPMSNPEGAKLLRAVSKVRGVQILSEAPQKRLNDYANKLKNNPGFIKWFVACVQTGMRPEKALVNTNVFLNFCLENVYGYIGVEGRKILDVMQAVSRPLSVPELSYISSLEPIRLQIAIHQLLQTNMLSISSTGDNASSETRYGLAELARSYLVKRHSVSVKDYQRYKGQEREIAEMHGRIIGGFSNDPSSTFRIAVRNKSDAVIASYLIKAFNFAKKNDEENAFELIEKAKELSPGFHEVHRVEAWIHAQFGNILAAKNAYEAAYGLAENDVNLIIWYAGFLMRNENDFEAAKDLLEKALNLSPNNVHAKLERARLMMSLEDFRGAKDELYKIKPSILSAPKRMARVYWDLLMQISDRRADKMRLEADYEGVLDSVEDYLKDFEGMPRDCIDHRHTKRINSLCRTLQIAAQHLYDHDLSERCDGLLDKLRTEMDYVLGAPRASSRSFSLFQNDIAEGTIVSLLDYSGFVSCSSFEENIYFRRGDFPPSESSFLKVGDRMKFRMGQNRNGICAVDCKLLQ